MRTLVIVSIALFSLAVSAQTPSTSRSDAKPVDGSAAVGGARSVTGPTIDQPQLTDGGKLYDDFSGNWLDQAKWLPTNPQCWGNVLECVREIRNHKLRLAARNFGARDSDSGIQWSESEVYFTKPNLVKSMTADIGAGFSGAGCPTNSTDYTHAQVQIYGTFFNTGSGDPSDDISASLIIWIDSANPALQQLSVYWGHVWPGSATDTPLTTYPVGKELTASLNWDKVNHQFIAMTEVRGEPETAERRVIPYPYPDITPPTNPEKALLASQHTLNCTSTPTYGQVEATFDNVIVN